MKKILSGSKQKIGQAPGVLLYTGDIKTEETKLCLWEYDDQGVEEKEITNTFEQLSIQKEKRKWLHFGGIHDVATLKKFGEMFSVHVLFLEDVLNPNQRPKVEQIEDSFFVSMKLLYLDNEGQVGSSVVSFVLLENILFSFSEADKNDWFLPVVKRLKDKQKAMRKKSTYYLLYALMDVLVDHSLGVLEDIGEEVEIIDNNVLIDADSKPLDQLYNLKKQLFFIRKQTSPLSELIHKMSEEIPEKEWNGVNMYFNDLLDHIIQVQETTKIYLDSITNIFDLYFSLTNVKMNRTIQMLTIITVVFLPLTLLTGMYGMNFQNMPGLTSPQGFWMIVIAMLTISTCILLYLKYKKWF